MVETVIAELALLPRQRAPRGRGWRGKVVGQAALGAISMAVGRIELGRYPVSLSCVRKAAPSREFGVPLRGVIRWLRASRLNRSWGDRSNR